MSDTNILDDNPEDDEYRLYYIFGQLVAGPKISTKFKLPPNLKCPLLDIVESFGYDSWKRENLHVLDKNSLLIVTGNYVQIRSLAGQRTLFFASTGGGSVSCVAVHPSSLCFASGERGTNPDVNIFGYPSCKLRKVLRNGTKTEYICMKFDPFSGDLLATQGGEPDHNLTIWHWAKEVPLLRCKSFSQDVYSVAFNDNLFGFLVTSGLNHIRFWRMAATFTGLKFYGQTGRFGQRDFCNIVTCVQFADGKVLSGSEDGMLLLWEEALLKAQFGRKKTGNCHRGQINQMLINEAEVVSLGDDGFIRTWHPDHIIFVEPSYHGQLLFINPLHEMYIPLQAQPMYMNLADPEESNPSKWYVQDRGGRIWHVDMEIGSSPPAPKILLQYHGGPVKACAASPNSYLVATTGHDGKVRIFDCLRKSEVLHMSFSAPASSLVWIPMSVDLQAAAVIVGFDDGTIRKVAFCEARKRKEGGKEEPPEVEGKLSQVFKPHKDRVTSLAFSPDGRILASGGCDKILFLFSVVGTNFRPFAWLYLPTGIRQLVWTPEKFFYRGLLAVCEDGLVVEAQLSDLFEVEVTNNLQTKDVLLKLFRFQSVKSEIQHEEELTRCLEEKIKAAAAKEAMRDRDEEEQMEESEEEEEDDWVPYIPESPSPILQAVYANMMGHFWLSVGSYDAGYLYLCKFPEQPVCGEIDTSTFLTKPVKSVPVPDCLGSSITVFKVDKERHRALMGFENGRIRLVQLTAELDEIGAYWDIAVHDSNYGSVTGLEFAFDDSYLLTTGMDGNILLFNYAGKLQKVEAAVADLPVSTNEHAICEEDLSLKALWFGDSIDMRTYEKNLQKAEKSKKLRRHILKELRSKLKSLLFQNQQLPPYHRLTCQELLVNIYIEEEHKQKQESNLAELRKRYAWHSEKTRLMLEKARNGFCRHEKLPHVFAVSAFSKPIQIRSLRVPAILSAFKEILEHPFADHGPRPSHVSPAEEESGSDKWMETSTDEAWENAYGVIRRKSVYLTGTASRCLKMALDKAFKARQKRIMRQYEWNKFYEEKAYIDKDSPEDLQKLEHAKATIGDFKLKTDPSFAIKMAETYHQGEAVINLAQIDEEIFEEIEKFNSSLRQLREEKYIIMQIFYSLDKYLCQLSGGTKRLPNPPTFSKEEIPEKDLCFDEKALVKFKDDFKLILECDFSDTDTRPSLKKERKEQKQISSHTYYNGEPCDYPDMVKSLSSQVAEAKEESSGSSDFDMISIEESQELDMSSPLRQYLHMYASARITFEEAFTSSIAEFLMEEFDDKLRNIRREKFELDVFLKRSELAYIAKLEEFLIQKKTAGEEKELKQEQISKTREFAKNRTATTHLKNQISSKTEENEDMATQSHFLWFRFRTACTEIDNDKLMRYLTQLYKHKIKKKEKREPDDEDYDSEEESSSGSVSLVSGSDSSSFMSLDLDVCPHQIPQELYDSVVAMQKERQTLDDAQMQLKNELAILSKELEQKNKESEVLERAKQKARERLVKFYEEKIRLLNEVITVVPLCASQVRSKISEEALVVNRKPLIRLSARVGELKGDIKEQEQDMNNHTKRHYALRRANRVLAERVQEQTKICQEEVVKKFGRPVDLKKLELITVNPKVELLRYNLLLDRERQDEETQKYNAQIKRLQEDSSDKTRETSARYEIKAELLAKLSQLEHQLDLQTGKVDIGKILPKRKESLADRDKKCLRQLVAQQNTAIGTCWNAIHNLGRFGKRFRKQLPPVPMRYTVQKMRCTRNIPDKTGGTKLPPTAPKENHLT